MSEHILEEELNGGKHVDFKQKAEDLRKKTQEMEEQVEENLNNIMSSTAENLEKVAEKMHETAKFFKDRNVDTLKDDFSHIVKKNPVKALGGALLIGFLAGKIIFK